MTLFTGLVQFGKPVFAQAMSTKVLTVVLYWTRQCAPQLSLTAMSDFRRGLHTFRDFFS